MRPSGRPTPTGKAAAAVVFIAISAFLLFVASGPVFSWDGVVVDASTAKPVSGAVIVRSWHRITATAAGGVTTFLGVEEGPSDRDGKFQVPWRFFGVSVPLMSVVEEGEAIVFKPGYEHLSLREKPSRIELVPVPTSPSSRKKALEDVQSGMGIVQDRTKLFRTMMEKEEEFVTASLLTDASPARDSAWEAVGNHMSSRGSQEGETAPLRQIHVRQQSEVRPSALSVEFLIRDLSDQDWGIQCEARKALIGLAKDAVEPLMGALKDDDPEIRLAAAELLGRIRDHRAVEALTEALEDDEPKVRHAAIRALGWQGDPAGVRTLIGLWKDTNAETRTRAAHALVESGAGAVDSLILALADEDPYVRWRSAWTMGRIRDTRFVGPLIDVLGDDAPEVRWMAVHALGEIRDRKAVGPLTALLRDRDTGIGSKARRSLERIEREARPETQWKSQDGGTQRPAIQKIKPVAPPGEFFP